MLGGLAFASLSAGGHQTCGVTTSGTGYCWGDNSSGQLGDGTQTPRASPVVVAGSLTFMNISTGADHSCGITTAGVAYCWGDNFYGQLGNGTATGFGAGGGGSNVPVKVLGQP